MSTATKSNAGDSPAPLPPGPADPERIRPELNLERWSIWQPAKSKGGPRAKILERDIPLPDGSRVVARVEVGFTQRGALTTEDQKTYYGLVKLWEQSGRSEERVVFSLRQLARILKKRWGTNVIDALTESLARLYATPFFWTRAYYDSSTGTAREELEGFRILDELKVARSREGAHTTKAVAYFRFNSLILKNLLANHSKPVLLDTVLSFQSEIAQMLYTNVDLILADKSHYQRRTRELFADLGLDGSAYKNPSNRQQRLQPALQELQGVPLSKGGTIASAILERTRDGADYKVVFRKGRARRPEPLPAPPPPAKESPAEGKTPLALQAEELVRYFYEIFHQVGTGLHLPVRALDQATSLIARRGYAQAKHVIAYAQQETQKGRARAKTFGWVLDYENQAVADYEKRHCEVAKAQGRQESDNARQGHEEAYRGAYHAYLAEWLGGHLERELPEAHAAFREFEGRQLRYLERGAAAGRGQSAERLAAFDAPEPRLDRFRAFLRYQAERRQRVPGVLTFWEWDREKNPESWERKRSGHDSE